MRARTSGGVATWVALAVFVCGTLALSSTLIAWANPSTEQLRERILEHPPDRQLPGGFTLLEGRTIQGEDDGEMHVGFYFAGPAHRNRIIFIVFDSAALARDDYLGHRESDRSAASFRPARIPRHQRARFLASTPGVRDSFCRATGDWFGECVSMKGRIVVLAESSVLPGQDQFVLPPGIAPGDPVDNAQRLLRSGMRHLDNI